MSDPIVFSDEEISSNQKKHNITPINKSKNEKINQMKDIEPITSSELSNLIIEPTKTLLSPWLKENQISMIFAEPGVGKTFFSLNCAYSLISGEKFLKFESSQVNSVLYIDAECGKDELQERWNMICKGNHFDGAKFYSSHMFPNDEIPQISSPEGREFYSKKIIQHKSKVVFFDNLSFLTEIDENKAQEWSPVLSWFKHLKNSGVSVCYVHHTNKGGREYRGSSKIKDLPNSVVYLEKFEDEKGSKGGARFTVKYDKNRGFYGDCAKDFMAYLDDKGSWHTQDPNISNREKAIIFYKRNMKAPEIAKELKISASRVYEFISDYNELKGFKK